MTPVEETLTKSISYTQLTEGNRNGAARKATRLSPRVALNVIGTVKSATVDGPVVFLWGGYEFSGRYVLT